MPLGATSEDVAAIEAPAPAVTFGSETLPLIPPTCGTGALVADELVTIELEAVFGVGVATGAEGAALVPPPPPPHATSNAAAPNAKSAALRCKIPNVFK